VAAVSPGPLLAGRTVRLWSLTTDGSKVVAELDRDPSIYHPHGIAPGPTYDPARQAVPGLVAAYRALGALAATRGEQTSSTMAWTSPDEWNQLKAGVGCPMCADIHLDETSSATW
jgi:hypothetical protein